MSKFWRIVGETAAWLWFLVAGLGGLVLLITKGPLPVTNGWFAMFSGFSASPLTAWLLKKYAKVSVPGWVRFATALFWFLAGRAAVVIVRHGSFLPEWR